MSPKRTCLLLSLEAVFVRFSVACFVVLPRGSGRLLLRVVHYLCKRVGIDFERDANLTFDVSRHITVRLIITHIRYFCSPTDIFCLPLSYLFWYVSRTFPGIVALATAFMCCTYVERDSTGSVVEESGYDLTPAGSVGIGNVREQDQDQARGRVRSKRFCCWSL